MDHRLMATLNMGMQRQLCTIYSHTWKILNYCTLIAVNSMYPNTQTKYIFATGKIILRISASKQLRILSLSPKI